MKTLLILWGILLSGVVVCCAQTPLDPPSITSQNSILTALHDSTINFSDTSIFAGKQSSFMFGHQWFNALSGVNKRLYMNCYTADSGALHSEYALSFYRYPRTYSKTSYINYDLRGGALGYCYSLQIDPEAPVTELNEFFIPNSEDTLCAIYGFRHKEGGYRGIDSNTNRYVYTADSGTPGTGRLILSSPIGTEALQRRYNDNDVRTNGTHWYLSINLRRLDAVWDDSTNINDTILSIKIPIKYRHLEVDTIITTYASIKFDSISSRQNGLSDKGYYMRGGWMEKFLSAANDSIFIIRRSMLPKFSDTSDITLSAFFRTKTSTIDTTTTNPWLWDLPGIEVGEIDSIGMEVRYYGNCNIAIDWLRFETPESRALFRGEKDSVIARGVSKAFAIVANFKNRPGGMPNARIWRFYITDEPSPVLIGASRYYSSLLEGYCITEGGGNNRYLHSVPKQPTFWSSTPRFDYIIKAPYIKYAIRNDSGSIGKKYREPRDNAFNYKGGWQYLWNKIDSSMSNPMKQGILNSNFMTATCDSNSDGSAYEKCSFGDPYFINQCGYLYPWVASIHGYTGSVIPDEAYEGLLNDAGQLGTFEKGLNDMRRLSKGILFSSKPWLSNIWIASEWHGIIHSDATVKPHLIVGLPRPQTGEEMRLYLWTALVFGAKGLMYDNFDCELSDRGKLLDTAVYHGASDTWLRMGAMGRYEGLSDAVLKNDTSGQFLLQSDKSGGDFFYRHDSTRIDQYINFDSSAFALGVSPNRIYCGRKSTRMEVMKIHDRVNSISDTLMRLTMQGWFSKGHRSYTTVRDNDTSYITKFLHPDSGYLKTRPCIRDIVEGWDSTFCDLTIHKDTNISMDAVFYVGVLNRRTNPLIRLADTLTFYSTAEFDSIVAISPEKKYTQGGSREITIPFNYKYVNGYSLLHVKELGGGIDTIIGQDVPLAAKFLPGEGKMFSVTVLPPDTTLTGVLNFTNQRKLVGYPIRRSDGSDSDSMYYHLTYHRYDSSSSKNKVYYRRSNKVWVNSSSENIKWENEILLSNKVFLPKVPIDTVLSPNSLYPSLVVRYDSTAFINKVYVVYSCIAPTFTKPGYTASGKQYIVENIIPAEGSQTADTARRLSSFVGTIDNYGTPMINASDSGNYYCWADSDLGIGVGWKRPNARALSTSKYVSVSYVADTDTFRICNHPSVNSYSRLRLKENDCALVWEEKQPDIDNYLRYHIMYTRLHVVNGAISNFLPQYLPVANGLLYFDSSRVIAELSGGQSTYATPSLPSVYRELTDSISSGGTVFTQRNAIYDCSVWHAYEMTGSPGYPYGSIYRRVLSIEDSSIGMPWRWYSDGLTRITDGTFSYLYGASISQGNARLKAVSANVINESDSSVVTTFTQSSALSELGVPPTQFLWQLRSTMLFSTAYQDTSLYLSSDPISSKTKRIDEYALTGQTAALPRIGKESDWRKNRRVYQRQTDPTTYGIQTSPKFFLKQGEQSDPLMFNGFSNGESKYILENPILNGNSLNLHRVRKSDEDSTDSGEYFEFTDTLTTVWFTVGEASEFSFRTIGTNSELVTSFVERKSDGEHFPIELRTSDDTTALKTDIELEQGGGEEYRFYVVKSNVNSSIPSHYRNEIMLNEIETITGYEKGSGQQIVYLGRVRGASDKIRVYPNPATNTLTIDRTSIRFAENTPVHYTLSTLLGGKVMEFDNSELKFTVQLDGLVSGVYLLTAESEGNRAAVMVTVAE